MNATPPGGNEPVCDFGSDDTSEDPPFDGPPEERVDLEKLSFKELSESGSICKIFLAFFSRTFKIEMSQREHMV